MDGKHATKAEIFGLLEGEGADQRILALVVLVLVLYIWVIQISSHSQKISPFFVAGCNFIVKYEPSVQGSCQRHVVSVSEVQVLQRPARTTLCSRARRVGTAVEVTCDDM